MGKDKEESAIRSEGQMFLKQKKMISKSSILIKGRDAGIYLLQMERRQSLSQEICNQGGILDLNWKEARWCEMM